MNECINIPITDEELIKRKVVAFSRLFDICTICDSNHIKAPNDINRYELIAGMGCSEIFSGSFTDIVDEAATSKKWVFSAIAYEAHKKLNSDAGIGIHKVFMYAPEIVIYIKTGETELHIINNGKEEKAFQELIKRFEVMPPEGIPDSVQFPAYKAGVDKQVYLHNVERIKDNITEGDFYEINYCQPFAAIGRLEDATAFYAYINKRSPSPFSAFCKTPWHHIICTSPERFIFKEGGTLISQPIKGTNKRLQGDNNDVQMKMLYNSEKDRAENVMIVDLVRNDLAQVCNTGSIKVEELFGIYAFAHVNQMISTVSGELKPGTSLSDIFKALYPMGSMTGAPKKEVMKHIEIYENKDRGFYSGCIGYIQPDGNFDFNVVIRTIVEDIKSQAISFSVGGAITCDSDPEGEYEECLMKAAGLTGFRPGQPS